MWLGFGGNEWEGAEETDEWVTRRLGALACGPARSV